MGSPSASARESSFSTTTPTPSLRTSPSARESKVLQRPSCARSPALAYQMVPSGERIRFAPPAMASVDSPLHKLRHARFDATSDDEQAVSIDMLGPRKSKKCERRLAAMPLEWPVTV